MKKKKYSPPPKEFKKEEILVNFLHSEIEKAKLAGEEMFLGVPDIWYEGGKHICNNGHISYTYLKSEEYGGPVCLKCYQPSHVCPPYITEEELKHILK